MRQSGMLKASPSAGANRGYLLLQQCPHPAKFALRVLPKRSQTHVHRFRRRRREHPPEREFGVAMQMAHAEVTLLNGPRYQEMS